MDLVKSPLHKNDPHTTKLLSKQQQQRIVLHQQQHYTRL